MRKLKGKYYARIQISGKEKLLPLKTSERKIADRRFKIVQEREWLVIIGLEEKMNLISTPTLTDAIKKFVKESSNKGLAAQTIYHYEISLRHFIKICGKTLKVEGISERMCRDFILNMKVEHSDESVNSYLKAINTFMNWARRKYDIKLPDKIKELRVERKLPEFLHPEELDKIYSVCEDKKMLATFKVYEHTGIRLRELHNCIIDESANGKYIKLRRTKGRKERIIPIPQEIVDDFKFAMTAPYDYNSNIIGLPYKADFITRTFSELRDKVGVASNKSLHSLRHTFALRKLLELGNIYLVSQMLGHSDVKTTQIYLDFPEGYLKEVFSDWLPRYKKTTKSDQSERISA